MEKATIQNLLTIDETAELLRVSKPTVYKLIDEGAFPSMKVGVQTRVDPADVQAYLNRQKESK